MIVAVEGHVYLMIDRETVLLDFIPGEAESIAQAEIQVFFD